MTVQGRIRKLASETAVYGVSSIFGRLINFLLFPFYSNVFAPDVFGPIIVIYAAFVFLNILYQYGMESAYLKFAADADTGADRSVTFSTAAWSLFGTAAIFSGLVVAFRQPFGFLLGLEASNATLLLYAAGILLLDTLTIVPYAELRLSNRPWRFAFIRTAGIVINVLLNVYLILVRGMGVEAILISNLTASLVSLLLLAPVYAERLRIRFNRSLMRELLRFGLPFVPGGLGYALSERVNIFFLERMSAERILELYPSLANNEALRAKVASTGTSVYAEYIVGAYGGIVKLAIILALVVQMFRYAWQPFFLQHAKDEDAAPLFARVFTLLTVSLLFVFLAVSFLADDLVAIPLPGGRHLIAPGYWLGLPVVPLVLIGYVFQGWYYHFSSGAYIQKKTRYFVTCTLAGSGLALVLNIFLVPVYGMAAAAGATSISYVVMALLLHRLIFRFYPIPYEWRRVLAVIFAASLVFALWFFIPALQHPLVEAVLVGIYAVVAFRSAGLTKSVLSGLFTRK